MKQKINWEDVISGFVIFVIGLVLFISSLRLPSGNELQMGADFMPKVVSGMLTVLGACFTITAFIKRNNAPAHAAALTRTELIRFSVAFALFFCYIFFLESVGFVIMTTLYIIAQSWFITPKEKRRPVFLCILAVSVSVIIYVIFVFGLKLMLPAGILG
ncbi:MAG: tripartite tricarboxylate transporter TctB family protein [Candidatus Heteroscillospira sp.]|jgi:putative tricarboxylic transport membrane protein